MALNLKLKSLLTPVALAAAVATPGMAHADAVAQADFGSVQLYDHREPHRQL